MLAFAVEVVQVVVELEREKSAKRDSLFRSFASDQLERRTFVAPTSLALQSLILYDSVMFVVVQVSIAICLFNGVQCINEICQGCS